MVWFRGIDSSHKYRYIKMWYYEICALVPKLNGKTPNILRNHRHVQSCNCETSRIARRWGIFACIWLSNAFMIIIMTIVYIYMYILSSIYTRSYTLINVNKCYLQNIHSYLQHLFQNSLCIISILVDPFKISFNIFQVSLPHAHNNKK